MKRVIEVYIDELILQGFPPYERYRIGEAIQAALHEHLTIDGLPPVLSAGGSISHIDAGSFEIHTAQQPENTGNAIATTIYKGFSNEG